MASSFPPSAVQDLYLPDTLTAYFTVTDFFRLSASVRESLEEQALHQGCNQVLALLEDMIPLGESIQWLHLVLRCLEYFCCVDGSFGDLLIVLPSHIFGMMPVIGLLED